ncbi:TA system antitoxin ParD family protein [Nocardioides sp. Bht2]|uniref:TA system antitoxin ParD family protein n=1 Tax=Nocardioides sp. Bht2 TaxID=3392297 RepID=UPI0039B375A2
MSSPTMPTRFDAGLFEAAKVAGGQAHRSAAQQLAHWARLGQELEASGTISTRDVERVLAGQLGYDELGERDQVAVRTAWREEMDDRIDSLDLRAAFAAQGRTDHAVADADGTVRQIPNAVE